MRSFLFLAVLFLAAPLPEAVRADTTTAHAIAMHGSPKYGPGFSHFDYVNADAPKGGDLRLHELGGFDNFMPWLPKGTAAAGAGEYLFDTLTVRSLDEPFSEYGLLAETIEWPEDRRWVTFTLRKEARFADGQPVRAEDVVWTFKTLRDEGEPFYAYYYGDVEKVEALSERKVKFSFKPGDNRELVMIVGQLPVMPKHYWKGRDFADASLEPPLGSGPYRVKSFKPGKRVVYERRDDYWAKDLPVMRGRYNFDRIIHEYYLDETVALEAFKRGDYDWRTETNSKLWATAYTGDAFRSGRLITEEAKHSNPAGMQGFVFNTRRPVFQDPVLREAITYAFDFEWSNKNLFYGQYQRTRSYFQNSDLAAEGPPDKEELALLEPLRKDLPPRVFTESYQPPHSDGSGRPRENLRHAQKLLMDAGYQVKGGKLHTPDGKPVHFEFLLYRPAFERIVLPFARNLKTLGIDANVVRVDQSQFVQRLRRFNFDMIVGGWGQSTSPGNEQRGFWSCQAAERESSQNYAGVCNPAVDALVDKVIAAQSREALVTRTRALDRALQWGFYVVPNWYAPTHRFAYRAGLDHAPLPAYVPITGALDLWWNESAR